MTDTADNAPGNALSSAKRIVIKIGSSLLVDAATGVLKKSIG